MPSPARIPEAEHPLLGDRDLLNEILDVMYAKIHKVLRWRNPGLRSEAGRLGGAGRDERTLEGTGTSADDILAEALWALLAFSPERLQGSWQGLAVTIANRKTIEALRTARKGLRGTEHRPELHLVPGHVKRLGSGGESAPSIFEMLPAEGGDPEAEYLALAGVRDLLDVVREVLDNRALAIIFYIHFYECTRKEVGEKLGLTGARVGQIYDASMRQLEANLRYPYPTSRPARGGPDDQ